jgi:hypothetical protein
MQLASNNIDIETKDNEGETPLQVARRKGHPRVAALIHNAELNPPTSRLPEVHSHIPLSSVLYIPYSIHSVFYTFHLNIHFR